MYKLPIHIQSFGALLIVQSETGLIECVSGNIELYLFEGKEKILGENIKKYLPNCFDLFSTDIFPILLDYKEVTWLLSKGTINISTRILSQKKYYIFELEYSSMPEQKIKAFDIASGIIKSSKHIKDLDVLLNNIVKDIQKWLQYDRVMLLKYKNDLNGNILTEVRKNDTIPSLLNHTYLLTPYRKQITEILYQNKIRLVENVEGIGVPIFRVNDEFFADISWTVLCETNNEMIDLLNYLGVKSIFTSSIYVKGKLWGNILCHHLEERKYVGTEIRKMIEVISQTFGDMIDILENEYQTKEFIKKEFILTNIKNNLLTNFDIIESLINHKQNALDLFNADSFVCFYDKKWNFINNHLSIDVLKQLTDELSNNSIKNIFATDTAYNSFPSLLPYVDKCAGILVIEISKIQKEYLIWFRKENKTPTNYIGYNEEKKPSIWNEYINNESIAWEKYELDIAKQLHNEIVHVLYVSSQKIKKMNDELADLFKKFNETDQKLKWMYDSSIHPNFLLNKDKNLIGYNKSASNLFEKIFHQKLENNIYIKNYIKKSQINVFDKVFEEVKEGKAHEFIYHYPNKYEIEYIWKIVFFPVYDSYSGFYAVSVSMLDITESEMNNRKIAELAMVTQKTSNLVLITDQNRKIVWVNDAFLKLSEYSLEEIVGKSPSFLQGDETNKDTILFLRKELNQKKSVQVEIINYSKTGKKYWIKLNIEPIFDAENNLIRFIALEDDITELKEKQQELEIAKHKAEEMNRIKTSFLANMSHEIRTPLNGILGLAQVMRKEDDLQEVKNLLEMQIQSGWRLLKTIEDILALSRLEAEGIANSLQKISITNLLDQLLPPLQISAQHKNLTIEYNNMPNALFCWADETMLTQIFHNIIGNAIKFTHKGHIIITTKIINNQIVVEVEDTGVGISKEYLSKIYNSFEQESSGYKRTHEGAGIGLSISKKYIKLLEGDIKVKSVKGQGSTFSIILPIKEL